MLNTSLISDLISKGDVGGVREAMEKSLAEGSQTFESDIARLIASGEVTREEGVAHADSPTNLIWRLQNDFTASGKLKQATPEPEEDEGPSFTEITLNADD